MHVAEIMTEEVEMVHPETMVDEIARRMKEKDCGFLPVKQGDRLIGVITDRDITMRCVAESLDPVTTMAEQIMSPGVLYCYEDEEVEEVLNNMGDNAVRRLPVLNRDKRLIGVVSLGDLAMASEDETVPGEALEQIRVAV